MTSEAVPSLPEPPAGPLREDAERQLPEHAHPETTHAASPSTGETSDAAADDERLQLEPSPAWLGALAGLLAAAVTAGAIVGFGRGAGGALRFFATVGRLALGDPVVAGRTEAAGVAAVGLLVHVIQVTALGAVFGLVASRARGVRLAALALAASVLAAIVHLALAPAVLRLGNAVTVLPLHRGQLVALYLLLAAGLALGMRVALLCMRLDERSS